MTTLNNASIVVSTWLKILVGINLLPTSAKYFKVQKRGPDLNGRRLIIRDSPGEAGKQEILQQMLRKF